VLTGPRLPHNWISTNIPEEGVLIRDRVLQFPDEPLREASKLLPELKEALPLLERAKYGIEFFGVSHLADASITQIKKTSGMERFSEFLQLLTKLAHHQNYRLLSSAQLQSFEDDASLKRISEVVDYISENYSTLFTMAQIAERVGMTESRFSRYFRRATGNTFTDFVNRLRINRACQLLMETDQYISTICYNVGFNNVANFNRRFMEVKGMTPTEFRKQGEERFGM
jgi:AraC-like DNA-binding protein